MSTATEMLAQYLTAEAALLAGKEITFQDRKLRMEDLPAIREGRREWERRVAEENMTSARVPTIGGMEMKVANFNPAPHQTYRFNRNY